ncbi:MAG: TetR family transcriptional regulator, partial [Hyphomicrobiales bacterium]
MSRSAARENTRLELSRHAARLFLERGVADTTGDDIAAAAGVATRTLWRHFRSKESAVEPLFT